MAPLIWIILPAYNAQNYLRQAAASIRAQTLRDFEVILVNDGSSDHTGHIAGNLASTDSRFRAVNLDKNTGIINALNVALRLARAPYICRMDADDIMHPQRLEAQYSYIRENPDTDVLGSLVELFPAGNVLDGYRRYIGWINNACTHETICRDIYIESPFAHPSIMMPAQRLAAIGGYRGNGWPEDYDLWLRCFHAGYRFAKVPRVLLYWRDMPHRLSRTDTRYAIDRFHACKAHYMIRHCLAGRETVIVWGAKRDSRLLARHLVAQGATIAAYVDVDTIKNRQHHTKPACRFSRRPVPFPEIISDCVVCIGSRCA